MSHLLDEVEMKALGCVIRLRSRFEENKAKEALTPLTEQLDLDDVGYFYDPADPDALCTVPGQLHGVISNTHPRPFKFGAATYKAVQVLNSVDDDYSKLLIIITDVLKETDRYDMEQAFLKAKDVMIAIYFVGKDHPAWLEELCVKYSKNTRLHWVSDAQELYDLFENFTLEQE